ncbi:MAG: type II toxin-antitoxin system HipA family toxin [Muribaculaceae bacterium]|nr:type II toxin-antitoxin system HipA family toxin [Muribaculaceae bacterium]
MRFLKVFLWGTELGRLAYNPNSRQCNFTFNPALGAERPDVSPLLLPIKNWENHQIAFGDERRIYQNLPPFIADSLPDSWGNTLFDQWVRKNRISSKDITPLYKLMFIGRRGMGALEFEPSAKDLEHPSKIDIKSLHELSLKIFNERQESGISPEDELTLQTLLSVGTSAGGRQIKAILAINPDTGEIKSGQVDGLKGFDYHLLKFEANDLPTSEIEIAFHEIASASGILMEECRLLEVEGQKHFLTKRFDRRNGEKIHMQTLAAINPECHSYEELFATCRHLALTELELEELFRRLVFNVMANNTDDHNKNFSFLLEEGGKWKLSPAYDMTFIFNRFGTDAQMERCLSVNGKIRDISKADLIEIGKENGIACPGKIIDQVADAVKLFPGLAEKYNIPSRWASIINRTLEKRLSDFGYPVSNSCHDEIVDSTHRRFSEIEIKTNGKGHYILSANIDGQNHRRFIRPNMELYGFFDRGLFFKSDIRRQIEILEQLFPPEWRVMSSNEG